MGRAAFMGNVASDLADSVFMDTLAEQLKLTVENSMNHPSLIIHGFLNECASDTPEGFAAVKRFMDMCHQLDPTRPATFATNRPQTDICFELTDIVSMNVYPAWYTGEYPCDIPEELKKYNENLPDKPVVISEIGAAAIYGDHSGTPWSEEYQSEYINTVLKSVADNPRYSGVMLWLYCNANTYIAPERARFRPRGFNNKGLLDEYRRPKLAWKNIEI
jgi:beta-glucuronidase